MSFKRLIILLLILSVFLSVNTISASDVNLNSSFQENALNSVDTEIFEVHYSDEVLINNELLGGDCPISVSDS